MSNDSPEQAGQSSGDSLDLSNLNFGPAWARDKGHSRSIEKFKDRADREDSRGRRDERRRGGGRGGDQRGGGRGNGGGRGGNPRGDRGERRDDRQGGGRYRRDDRRGGERRPARPMVPPTEGVTAFIRPTEEVLDGLAKQIKQTGRSYSVVEMAKLCMKERERFQVVFEREKEDLFVCKEDQSVFVSREEALGQLWRGDWTAKFYQEIQEETEAPKGNYSSVAKCGFSGVLLGPPNYHGYQQALVKLHREKFSNMTLERYKSRIQMEHGEEVVSAWRETMTTVTRWIEATIEAEEVVTAEENSPAAAAAEAESKAEAAEAVTELDAAAVVEEEKSGEILVEGGSSSEPAPADDATSGELDGSADPENDGESTEEAKPEEKAESPEEVKSPEEAQPVKKFQTPQEVEQHFLKHHFKKVFRQQKKVWTSGAVNARNLSRGLLEHLKVTVEGERRHPSKMIPVICRQLSGRGAAVYKLDKKLKAGPARPRAVSEDTKLADRPQQIMNYLRENNGKKVAELWKAIQFETLSEDVQVSWTQDLHWLLNSGYAVLLDPTGILVLGKGGTPEKRVQGKTRRVSQKKEEKTQSEAKVSSKAGSKKEGQVEACEEKEAAEEVAPELVKETGGTPEVRETSSPESNQPNPDASAEIADSNDPLPKGAGLETSSLGSEGADEVESGEES